MDHHATRGDAPRQDQARDQSPWFPGLGLSRGHRSVSRGRIAGLVLGLLAGAIVVLVHGLASAQCAVSYTAGALKLHKPASDCYGWDTDYNSNWDQLDATFGGLTTSSATLAAGLAAEISRATARENALGNSTGTIAANQLMDEAIIYTLGLSTGSLLAIEYAQGASTMSIAASTTTLGSRALALEVAQSTQAAVNYTMGQSTYAAPGTGSCTLPQVVMGLNAHGAPTCSQPSNVTGTSANVTGTVAVANGGTGAANAPGARVNLSAAQSGSNADIQSLAGVNGALVVSAQSWFQDSYSSGAVSILSTSTYSHGNYPLTIGNLAVNDAVAVNFRSTDTTIPAIYSNINNGASPSYLDVHDGIYVGGPTQVGNPGGIIVNGTGGLRSTVAPVVALSNLVRQSDQDSLRSNGGARFGCQTAANGDPAVGCGVALISPAGQIPALTSTYFASLDASNLTGSPSFLNNYLPLAGGMMTGSLTMSNHLNGASSQGNINLTDPYYHSIVFKATASPNGWPLGQIQWVQGGTGMHRIISFDGQDTAGKYPGILQVGADQTASEAQGNRGVLLSGSGSINPDLYVSTYGWTSIGTTSPTANGSQFGLWVGGNLVSTGGVSVTGASGLSTTYGVVAGSGTFGNALTQGERLGLNDPGGSGKIMSEGGGNPSVHAFTTSGNVDTEIISVGGGIGYSGTASNQDYGLISNGVERMRVTVGGNVGVGTTNPGTTASVNGTVTISSGSALGTLDTNQLLFGFKGTEQYRHAIHTEHNGSGAAGNLVSFYTWSPSVGINGIGNTLGLTINNGQVGINTTTPATTLDVNGSAQFGSGAAKSTATITGDYLLAGQAELALGAFTTAQVQAKTPNRAGTLIYNSTLSLVCVSTGTTVQGYARLVAGGTCQ